MTEKATFAAGCFWGVQAEFDNIEGVEKSTVGYAGGETPDPTYKDVCGGGTGHAEAVELEFDPDVVSYGDLLAAFWSTHDPTQLNRQGPDVGVQYRSAVFYHSPEQEAAARESKEALDASGTLNRPVATEVVPAGKFYPAEENHQKYFEKRGGGSCHI